MKRAFDVVVASTLLILLSPLELIALAAMTFDMVMRPRDRGSFFYREPRVSCGETFHLLKLRTLRSDVLAAAGGHARLLELEPSNLTWAGRRLLKPWYLDELPQLWNVVRGDISLVGPRPWPPALVERQVAEGYDYRNRVLAGLTGPAQVSKGSGRAYLDLDLEYVEASQTLKGWQLVRRDLGILRRTLRVLARGEGLEY